MIISVDTVGDIGVVAMSLAQFNKTRLRSRREGLLRAACRYEATGRKMTACELRELAAEPGAGDPTLAPVDTDQDRAWSLTCGPSEIV